MKGLNLNLRDFWRARYVDGVPVIGRVLHGGRMSSKSTDVAIYLVARSRFRQETILCTRTYQNRIDDSVYTLLKEVIEAFDLKAEFKILKNEITHRETGSVFKFYGTARNADEIKSMQGVTIWWHEEAHNLKRGAFDLIRPTVMRNPDAMMIFTFNPQQETDFSYDYFVKNTPAGFLVRQINYTENYNLPQGALDDIKKAFEEDPDLADHIYNGRPLSNDELSIIKRKWILAAIDAHKKLDPTLFDGAAVCGYDVADDGQDRNAAICMRGGICVAAYDFKSSSDELDLSAKKVALFAGENSCAIVGYDSVGVGASTGIHLARAGIKKGNIFKFSAGSGVFQPDKIYKKTGRKNLEMFHNLKAQSWWEIADRFRATYNAITRGVITGDHKLIAIDSKELDKKTLDQLVDELAVVRFGFSDHDKIQVEKKEALKKREIASPNLADAFIIANSRDLVKKTISRPIINE